MKKFAYILSAAIILSGMATSCMSESSDGMEDTGKKIQFDVTVTRDGKLITKSGIGVMTKSASYSDSDQEATMDPDTPFGLIGVDSQTGKLLIDNEMITEDANGNWGGYFNEYLWSTSNKIDFSAYYPYVSGITYGDNNSTYTIPYSVSEVDAGPLVSKTVEKAVASLNMVPIEFQHITNDLGYKVCDATPDKNLQGLIHLRKLTSYNVASAGIFVDTLGTSQGIWKKQGYYRNVVVFEGDAPVGVGSANEKFVGYDSLVGSLAESHRFYSVPDEIKIGRQYVEVVYDIDSFTHNGFTYPAVKNQVAKYLIYGLLPNNEFVYGKQYTFHIGIDISSVYPEITFAPGVSDWATNIYENNDTF